MIIKPDPDAGHDGDETDVATMANVNLENEAKKLQRADIGNEIRNAPGGDEQIYVNKAGNFFDFETRSEIRNFDLKIGVSTLSSELRLRIRWFCLKFGVSI